MGTWIDVPPPEASPGELPDTFRHIRRTLPAEEEHSPTLDAVAYVLEGRGWVLQVGVSDPGHPPARAPTLEEITEAAGELLPAGTPMCMTFAAGARPNPGSDATLAVFTELAAAPKVAPARIVH